MNWFCETDIHFIIRLIIACICGMIIGIERKSRAKEAGIRTHCLVACASALMMIISKYAYDDILRENFIGGVGLDPSRVASGVVSGVGFLGAGMIFIQKRTITGLTTAAGIWATSGIGMAIGAGMYAISFSATALILLVQFIFHINFRRKRLPQLKRLVIQCLDGDDDIKDNAISALKALGVCTRDIGINKDITNRVTEYIMELEVPADVSDAAVVAQFNCNCSLTMKTSE